MTAAAPTIYLVGEHNPYGLDPKYALFPAPITSAGGRLCRWILGMPRHVYLSAFVRRNLITDASKRPRWSVPRARAAARALVAEAVAARPGAPVHVIALGARVAPAFTTAFKMWEPVLVDYVSYVDDIAAQVLMDPAHGRTVVRAHVLALPHPSGQNRIWNDPDTIDRARDAVRGFAPHLAPLLGSAL